MHCVRELVLIRTAAVPVISIVFHDVALDVLYAPLDDKLTATSPAKTFEFVGTFFQRYTDEETEWAYGTLCAPLNLLFHIDSRIGPQHHHDLEQRLRRLLRREVVYNIDDACNYIQGTGLYTIALSPDVMSHSAMSESYIELPMG
jgi:hypothetical protein